MRPPGMFLLPILLVASVPVPDSDGNSVEVGTPLVSKQSLQVRPGEILTCEDPTEAPYELPAVLKVNMWGGAYFNRLHHNASELFVHARGKSCDDYASLLRADAKPRTLTVQRTLRHYRRWVADTCIESVAEELTGRLRGVPLEFHGSSGFTIGAVADELCGR